MTKKRMQFIRRLEFSVCLGGIYHPAWQLIFFGIPLGLIVCISFCSMENFSLRANLTLHAYNYVFSQSRYCMAVINSLRLALLCATISASLGFPVAYAIRFIVSARWRRICLGLLVLPFFSSSLTRMFGWQLWLSDGGVLAWIGHKLRIEAPRLLYSELGVLLGLVSLLLPLASVFIFLSLTRLDDMLIIVGRQLGGSRWQVFRRITLPYTIPGIVVAFLFCFLLSLGDFVATSLLGGNAVYYLSTAISDRMKVNDWPSAAVLGSMLLGLSIVAVSIGIFFSQRWGAKL